MQNMLLSAEKWNKKTAKLSKDTAHIACVAKTSTKALSCFMLLTYCASNNGQALNWCQVSLEEDASAAVYQLILSKHFDWLDDWLIEEVIAESNYQSTWADKTLGVKQQFGHAYIAAVSWDMQRRQIVLRCTVSHIRRSLSNTEPVLTQFHSTTTGSISLDSVGFSC